uniref:Peptidase S1 domain-containing protein n=1 Tax=Branchiostoma floridae TaxID=7739 RepID=C3YE72_BRAFL|eukprot:XP_002605370.1 hypothetical protein BRAFLDRAFT_74194 [Branchiostoma floridae]
MDTNGQSRIVGGDTAIHGAWPWQVQFRSNDYGTPFCGGTLVAPEWVLTAAHCLKDYRRPNDWPDVQVVIGKHLLQHPGDTDTEAVVASVQKTSNFVNFACLEDNETTRFDENSYCFTTGWGETYFGGPQPDRLQELKMALIPTAVCNGIISYDSGRLTDGMICAGHWEGGADACSGDSGGPLVCAGADNRWYVIGITSWGDGCADRYKPGVFTKVSSFISWMDDIMSTSGQVSKYKSSISLM